MLERLARLRDFDCSQNLEPRKLVELGLCDAVKLFVKNEPHKLSKLQEGRVRLIFSMSLIDNIIARMLCSLQNNTEINQWELIPSKPGMGLNDASLRTIYQNVINLSCGGKIAESDISGWDWSVYEWELEADFNRRLELNGGRGTIWESIARAHFYCVARKVMVLSDGTMYQQLTPGIMPSGWYNTSSTNSFMRALDHYMVVHRHNSINNSDFSPDCIVMGDDGVERWIPDGQEMYRGLGKTVKMYTEVSSEHFEFCSTLFKCGLGVPVNVDKQIVNLLYYKPFTVWDAYERINQFEYELRNLPGVDKLIELIKQSGWWTQLQ